MIEPVVRQAVFDTYWKFAAERQAIFERRAALRAGARFLWDHEFEQRGLLDLRPEVPA